MHGLTPDCSGYTVHMVSHDSRLASSVLWTRSHVRCQLCMCKDRKKNSPSMPIIVLPQRVDKSLFLCIYAVCDPVMGDNGQMVSI